MTDKVVAYEMEMTFSASIGFREINDMLSHMGMEERLQIKDALKISLKQVLPCIPDEDYLRQAAQIIKETYRTRVFTITECHFVGYRYIREIAREVSTDD